MTHCHITDKNDTYYLILPPEDNFGCTDTYIRHILFDSFLFCVSEVSAIKCVTFQQCAIFSPREGRRMSMLIKVVGRSRISIWIVSNNKSSVHSIKRMVTDKKARTKKEDNKKRKRRISKVVVVVGNNDGKGYYERRRRSQQQQQQCWTHQRRRRSRVWWQHCVCVSTRNCV